MRYLYMYRREKEDKREVILCLANDNWVTRDVLECAWDHLIDKLELWRSKNLRIHMHSRDFGRDCVILCYLIERSGGR